MTAAVYHAVVEEALPFLDIATTIGLRLGLPVELRGREHFGWFAAMAGAEMSASGFRTRALLGWRPIGPGLLSDLEQPGYGAG